jgi:hypothetical protein
MPCLLCGGDRPGRGVGDWIPCLGGGRWTCRPSYPGTWGASQQWAPPLHLPKMHLPRAQSTTEPGPRRHCRGGVGWEGCVCASPGRHWRQRRRWQYGVVVVWVRGTEETQPYHYFVKVEDDALHPSPRIRINIGRLWHKTCIEVVCCYVSHHPTVLSPLSHLRCDNQKLVYFLVNSSCLYVLSCKFISCITLTVRFNLMSHAKYIVLCGVSHLVIYYLRYHTRLVFHLPYHTCCRL